MNRMTKDFKKAGLIYDSMDDIHNQIYYRPENDMSQHVVSVTDKFIICVWYSEVLDPELRLYDHQYKLIATQNLYPDTMCFGVENKWMSYVLGEEDRINI